MSLSFRVFRRRLENWVLSFLVILVMMLLLSVCLLLLPMILNWVVVDVLIVMRN